MLTTLSKDLVCEASTQTSDARRISTEMKTQTLLTKTIIPIQSLICRFIQRNKSQLIWRFRDDKLLWRAHQNNLNCAHHNIQALTHKTKCRLESWCSKWPKKAKGSQDQKTTKKVKMTRKMKLLFLQRITTPTPPEPVPKTTKMLPQKSNIILPQLNLILLEMRMMTAAMILSPFLSEKMRRPCQSSLKPSHSCTH